MTAAIALEKMPNASTLPTISSRVEMGETRNSSNNPLVRSRTTDRAINVAAMCCRISARTAAPKNWTTVGCEGAMFSVSVLVGDATTFGGI